jgi:hypothetical protein
MAFTTTYFAPRCDFRGKAVEQFALQRLVLKFVKEPACILVREPIVDLANRSCNALVHTLINSRLAQTRPIPLHGMVA